MKGHLKSNRFYSVRELENFVFQTDNECAGERNLVITEKFTPMVGHLLFKAMIGDTIRKLTCLIALE